MKREGPWDATQTYAQMHKRRTGLLQYRFLGGQDTQRQPYSYADEECGDRRLTSPTWASGFVSFEKSWFFWGIFRSFSRALSDNSRGSMDIQKQSFYDASGSEVIQTVRMWGPVFYLLLAICCHVFWWWYQVRVSLSRPVYYDLLTRPLRRLQRNLFAASSELLKVVKVVSGDLWRSSPSTASEYCIEWSYCNQAASSMNTKQNCSKI